MYCPVRYKLYDIRHRALQRQADFLQGFCGHMASFTHLGNGGRANPSDLTHIFFLRLLVDKQLPQRLIADSQ